MEKKYWIPALERANKILKEIAEHPSELRLIDLTKRLNISKSSMYSLLFSLENLGWIIKERGDTYILGPAISALSAGYFRQFNILESFYIEAASSKTLVNETIQLAVLDGDHIIYLAKLEADSPFTIISHPGMRLPAHYTALGKMLLTTYSKTQVKELYKNRELETRTPFSVKNVEELLEQLDEVKRQGYSTEFQESAIGVSCLAAPVKNYENKMIAAVSFTFVNEKNRQEKYEIAKSEIIHLAQRLSNRAGHLTYNS